MDIQESTIANADLWSHYFQEQWSTWFRPLSPATSEVVSDMADGTAARVASFLTLVVAGPIAWLYRTGPEAGEPLMPTQSEYEASAA